MSQGEQGNYLKPLKIRFESGNLPPAQGPF